MKFARPTFVRVNLNAVASNIRAIRRKVGKHVGVMAVVKAQGYGQGMVESALACLRGGAVGLCVATIDEAVELREALRKKKKGALPILLLGAIRPADAPLIFENKIRLALGSLPVARALNRYGQQTGRKAKIHLKADTGMGRFGFWFEDIPPMLSQFTRLTHVEYEGIFTHFADSDIKDLSYTKWQLKNFNWLLARLKQQGYVPPIRHTANSGGILQHPSSYFEWVRPGIMIGGLYPTLEVKKTVPLEPALTLMTQIINLRHLPPGRLVSYGRTFKTRRPTLMATLPLGYGDGYPRALSNKGWVMLRGKKAPIIGRVCMDQFLIDVTHLKEVRVGEPVVVLGKDKNNYVPIEEIAALIGTIPNEIVTHLGSRLPRVYVGRKEP